MVNMSSRTQVELKSLNWAVWKATQETCNAGKRASWSKSQKKVVRVFKTDLDNIRDEIILLDKKHCNLILARWLLI
jgi:hypothetical protein